MERAMISKGHAELFEYDRQAPLGLEGIDASTEGSSRVLDIRYNSGEGRPVKAYMVEPMSSPASFGVIYLYPGPGDRSSFLAEGKVMAGKGATALLIDGPWADPQFGPRVMG